MTKITRVLCATSYATETSSSADLAWDGEFHVTIKDCRAIKVSFANGAVIVWMPGPCCPQRSLIPYSIPCVSGA